MSALQHALQLTPTCVPGSHAASVCVGVQVFYAQELVSLTDPTLLPQKRADLSSGGKALADIW